MDISFKLGWAEAHELSEFSGLAVRSDLGKSEHLSLMSRKFGEVSKALGEHSFGHGSDRIENSDISDTELASNKPFLVTKKTLKVGEVHWELFISVLLLFFGACSEATKSSVRDRTEVIGMSDQGITLSSFFVIGGHKSSLSGGYTDAT
jgi:hypothetical protein